MLLGGVSGQQDMYPFLPELAPTDMLFTVYYSWAIWGVMLISCLFGIGRTLEGPSGEMVKDEPWNVKFSKLF